MASVDHSGAHPSRHTLLALVGYALTALLLLRVILPVFATAIPGGPVAQVDGWQNVWNLWWVQRALASAQNPFVTPLLFYPQGVSLYLQTLGITNGILVLPITALWGPVAGYNAALLLALTLTGLAGYALALHVSGDKRAAFLAGLLFTLAPSHLTRVWDGQLELASLQWAALYLLCLLRALEAGRRRDAILAGVLLALTGLTSWYALLFMALMSLGLVLLWAPSSAHPRPLRARGLGGTGLRGLIGQAALVAGTAAVLLLPVIVPAIASATRQGAVARPEPDELLARSANLLDFWLPSYLHPLWGEAIFARVGPAWHNFSGDWNAALSYSVLALAALGAVTRWRESWRWLVLAGGALLFALGSELQIGGWRTGVPLPYALLNLLPGLSLGRRPGLFVAAATLALIPPSALGLSSLGALIQRRGRPLLWAIPLLLMAIELLPRPWPLLPAAMHPAYQTLAGGSGAVLEVPPAAYKYVEPQRAQLVHGRPILGGYLARSPSYPWPNLMPAVRPLWKMRPEPADPFVAGSDGPLAALHSYGISTVLVRWDQIEPERRAAVREALAQALPGVSPSYADATLAVYQVPDVAPGLIAALAGDGWQRPEGDGARRWRWMGEVGDLVLINPNDVPQQMVLRLAAHSFQRPRVVQLTLDGAPAGTWEVGLDRSAVTLHLWLTPGAHRLTLQAPADREPIANSARLLSIALDEARLP